MLTCEVAFPLPLFKTFRYSVPDRFKGALARGSRVRAPFGFKNALKNGVVVSVGEQTETPSFKLKEIAGLLDPAPLLSDELLDLALWLSQRFLAPLGEAIAAVFPQYLKTVKRRSQRPSPPPLPPEGEGSDIPSPPPLGGGMKGEGSLQLTPSQAHALGALQRKLEARKFEPVVLFGLPASGKTEVYLRLAERAVAGGGQVLFLVPEISLTHPFVEAFRGRLGLPVVTWHSKLGFAGKREQWLALARGERQVVIGARSAALLPFKDLRLAVLDEEQDESYKQDEPSPRYHAREVLLERARRHDALLVLGSATPSLETFHAARQGDWAMLELRDRVSELKELPRVEIADRRKIGRDMLGPRLVELIADRLARREQVILLVNRRGFANFVTCRKCGWAARCRSCGVALVLHRVAGKYLLCHHCGHQEPFPETCPNCRAAAPLHQGGVGTQRIAMLLRELFPQARVLRMDRDVTAKEDPAGAETVRRFREREADILVGTRLVSKGFHFPEVTLVGVVDADTPLNLPDFRAAEKTFTLYFQSGGRAGRGDKEGLVVVQSSQPDHYAMHALMARDFRAFAETELEHRRELGYPPFTHVASVLFHGANEVKVARAAEDAGAKLAGHPGLQGLEVLGPTPCVYARLKGRTRYQLMLKSGRWQDFRGVFDALAAMDLPPSVRWGLNLDPLDLF